MEFINWHYKHGIKTYIKGFGKTIENTLRFFSLPVLFRTLFSPWKRLYVKSSHKGLNLTKWFDDFTFNITSRLVGLLVRSGLIIISGMVLLFLFFIGFIGLTVWLIFPPLSYPLYQKYHKQPAIFARDLAKRLMISVNPITELFNNDAGQFVLSHIGINKEEIIEKSIKFIGIDLSKNYSGYADLITTIIESGVWSDEFWKQIDINSDDLILAARIWDEKRQIISGYNIPISNDAVKGIGIELLFGYTPTLDKIGRNYLLMDSGSKLRGRDEIITRIIRIISEKTGILLIGQPGVGKKALLVELSHLLDKQYKKLVDVSVVNLTEGVTDANERKLVLQNLLYEASSAGNVILSFHDLPRLTNSMIEGNDFTDIFEDHLEQKRMPIVAVTTPDEYEKYLARNFKLMKYFEKVEINPLDGSSATQVLIDIAADLELKTKITIPIPILRKMVILSDRYFSETPYPKKALELLESTVTYVRNTEEKVVTIDALNHVLSEKTGVPVATLTTTNKKLLSNIENTMHTRLVGQHTAINLIGKSLRSRATGVAGGNKPIGSFLFLGPTGVGKTETAKVLSQVYFGHGNILRFDMAEYAGFEGVSKLIGSAQLNQPGLLTTAIRNNPAGMVLFDEIEKASKEIFNILLTLFDEGYIMDAHGRKVDCRNIFAIATSNAGSEIIRESVSNGIAGKDLQDLILENILRERIFSPEFINRFDGVVVFEPLSFNDLTKIAEIQLSDLKDRMSEKNINLEFHTDLYAKLAKDGYDPIFGARPMKRVVNLIIGDLISQAILSDNIKSGDRVMLIPGEANLEYFLEKLDTA